MSGGNSWTILASEETVAETLKPLTPDHHEGSRTSAADSGEPDRPANGTESADALHVDDDLASEEKPAELSGDCSSDQRCAESASVPDGPAASCFEVSATLVHCDDVPSEDQAELSPESFCDSYTHVAPPPDESAASAPSAETLGSAEFSQEEEKLSLEATLQPLNGEKLHQDEAEEEESDYLRTTDLGKQAVHLVDQLVLDLFSIWARRVSGEGCERAADSEAADEKAAEEPGEEEEPEVRQRRSLLAALEQIGQREEEEAEEGEFQLPQQEDDSGFSVNKCILGAVILLGLGTIFFSGVFMDLDEESDYNTRELKEAAAPEKQDWLNPEVPPHPVDADSSELLNKLAEGNEQISVLQAQLQAQKDELKVAMGHAAEGAKERLRWEEVEKENSRLKTELASLPVLQKENERMKKELESIPALQKEVETLRATVTELKLSPAPHTEPAPHTAPAPSEPVTSPPGGQAEDSRPETAGSEGRQERKQWDERKEKKKDAKREKHDMGEKKDWKEREKSAWKEGEKRERKDGGKKDEKKVKHEFGKEKEDKHRRHSEEAKEWKEKDWKKDKDKRGDEGKPWKNRDGKKEWRDKSGSEEKDWKKGKSEKVSEGKWRDKGGNKDWKDRGERQKNKEEWKRMKDGSKEGGKDKGWKEKREWKNKNGKEGKGRGERKEYEGGREERKQLKEQEWKSKNGKHEKEWKRRDKRPEEEDWKRGQKERKQNGDAAKDKSKKSRFTDDPTERHRYGERTPAHSHRKPPLEQPEYWRQQKDRLLHDPKPPQQCDSVESCAQQERLRPVPLAQFESILQSYLAKAEQAGVDKAKIEELQKLTPDFFQDGTFVHDKLSFQDFVEDVGDILEDMVEGDEDEEDGVLEEEMEGFEREVMKEFSVAGDKEKRIKGEWRKEGAQARG